MGTEKLTSLSIVDAAQYATIITKTNSGASNNYWCTEDQLVLTEIKVTHNEPTVKLPNNATMNATKTYNVPLSGNISLHAKKAHLFMDCTVPRLFL